MKKEEIQWEKDHASGVKQPSIVLNIGSKWWELIFRPYVDNVVKREESNGDCSL